MTFWTFRSELRIFIYTWIQLDSEISSAQHLHEMNVLPCSHAIVIPWLCAQKPWALRSPLILAIAGLQLAGFILLLTHWTRFYKPMASEIIVQPTHAVVPDQQLMGLCSQEWNTTARCLPNRGGGSSGSMHKIPT